MLFDTNQLLQQAKDKNEIVSATANQLIKLLGKDIVFYLTEGETLGEPHIFTVSGDKTDKEITGTKEEAVAEWVLKITNTQVLLPKHFQTQSAYTLP